MTLNDEFNNDMYGGEDIPGMIRHNGHYVSNDENSDGTFHVLFDNGNLYTIKDQEVIYKKDGNHIDFIDKQIERFLKQYINGHPSLFQRHKYIVNKNNELLVDGDLKLRLLINRDDKSIIIPKIMVSVSKYRGYGKEVLSGIYEIASKHLYKVLLVEMVESFYDKMVKRGAQVIYPYDVVEITSETRLVDNKFQDIQKQREAQWENENLE